MIENKIENFLYSKSSKEALFKGIEDITEKKRSRTIFTKCHCRCRIYTKQNSTLSM